MQNVKLKEVFVDKWTAELFLNFTGVGLLNQFNSDRDYVISLAEDFIDVIERHFEGTSLNNSAEEIADYHIATHVYQQLGL